jgi:predicted dienelactone hydrolase
MIPWWPSSSFPTVAEVRTMGTRIRRSRWRAPFIVAAVNHAGDTYDDQSRVLDLWLRPDQLHGLITFMLTEWHSDGRIDVRRVGAFGFSDGGFTSLVAAGGVPDWAICTSEPHFDRAAFHRGLNARAFAFFPGT